MKKQPSQNRCSTQLKRSNSTKEQLSENYRYWMVLENLIDIAQNCKMDTYSSQETMSTASSTNTDDSSRSPPNCDAFDRSLPNGHEQKEIFPDFPIAGSSNDSTCTSESSNLHDQARESLKLGQRKRVKGHTPPSESVVRNAHISNDYVRLTELVADMDPRKLKEILQRRLKKKDSKIVVALSLLLPRTAFPPIKNVHCVRCHRNYDPKSSAVSTCTLKHPNSHVDKRSQDSNGANFRCRSCRKEFRLIKMYFYDENVNSFMTGFCFQGNHTTDPLEVRYGGAYKTCEEIGCVEFYV